MLGKDVILSLDGKAVVASTGCELAFKRDFIETCSPKSGPAKSFKPTTSSWTGSTSVLVSEYWQELVQAIMDGKLFRMKCRSVDGNVAFYGDCYLDSGNLSAGVKAIAKSGLTLLGTGAMRDYDEAMPLESSEGTPDAVGVEIDMYTDGEVVLDDEDGNYVRCIPLGKCEEPILIKSLYKDMVIVSDLAAGSEGFFIGLVQAQKGIVLQQYKPMRIPKGSTVEFKGIGEYYYLLVNFENERIENAVFLGTL